MSSRDDTYNGYANKETWGLALILDNDEGTHLETMRMAKQVDDDTEPPDWVTLDTPHEESEGYRRNMARSVLADSLQEWVEEMALAPDYLENAMLANAWTDWLARVDWHELAGNYLENAKELAD